jgi:hypothetical protein
MGKPGQADEMSLKAQVVSEPFERWALDFIGPVISSNKLVEILLFEVIGCCLNFILNFCKKVRESVFCK